MKKGLCLLAALLFTLSAMTFTLRYYLSLTAQTALPARLDAACTTLILDAGHGGEDGGAVSVSGVPESGINLAIVQKTEQILSFYGICPVVLREEDISLHDESAKSLREKKVSDLRNRVAAIQALPDATLVSIHQNSYPTAKYHGAQVFYAPTEGSAELAAQLQQHIKQTLQPDNTRECKEIPDTVYLMNHISNAAVLIECGFLTNPQEDALLQEGGYQCKLAATISAVLLEMKE